MTNDSTPRILLLGDYSNCHVSLAQGLGTLGCDVTLASNGSNWMQTERQVDLSRKHPGKLGGLVHFLDVGRLLATRLKGFDIVALHDPHFANLKPRLLRPLFDLLRRNNHRIFQTAMSTDIPFLDMLEAPDSPLRYSEWFVDGQPSRHNLGNPGKWESWHSKDILDYQRHFYDHLDGAVSVLYEYQLGMERRLGKERAAYGGLPIDTQAYCPMKKEDRFKTVLFLGRDKHRQLMKGSDYLEVAARKVAERHPDSVAFELVENLPFKEFVKRLGSADLVLDQIYSYTPATTALMAMSMGLPVVSGGEPEYYDYIGENENRPILNAPLEPDALEALLEEAVSGHAALWERGEASRRFAVKHNDSRVVARRFLDFWLSKC